MLGFKLFIFAIIQITRAWNAENRYSTFTNRFGDYKIRYKAQGISGPPVLFIHGFGGNADQFRLNAPILAEKGYKAYALDLLGYGYSDKPNPRKYPVNDLYNFDTWSAQVSCFIEEVIKEPCVLVCNSIGGVVGLQSAINRPDLVKGVVLINMSLRMLHVKKQSILIRPLVLLLQTVLRESGIGNLFFKQVATKSALKNILGQAYANPADVTDEVIEVILAPGLAPGAADVFLDFISYSGGPLPEDLLEGMPLQIPVRILWGENDPWEPIELGRSFAAYPCVDEFVTIPGGGHCPMDQVPDRVNAELLRFLDTKSKGINSVKK